MATTGWVGTLGVFGNLAAQLFDRGDDLGFIGVGIGRHARLGKNDQQAQPAGG